MNPKHRIYRAYACAQSDFHTARLLHTCLQYSQHVVPSPSSYNRIVRASDTYFSRNELPFLVPLFPFAELHRWADQDQLSRVVSSLAACFLWKGSTESTAAAPTKAPRVKAWAAILLPQLTSWKQQQHYCSNDSWLRPSTYLNIHYLAWINLVWNGPLLEKL